jgi:hypothetical protein
MMAQPYFALKPWHRGQKKPAVQPARHHGAQNAGKYCQIAIRIAVQTYWNTVLTELNFSLAAARALHLAAQGLLQPRRRKAHKADVLEAIRAMGVLQIDTIHVVARSPYLVLWSRLGDYPQAWLEEHLAEGALFEYWAHEACFVPIEDYRLLRHRMVDPAAMGWKYSAKWMHERRADVQRVLQHIRNGSPRSVRWRCCLPPAN